ncbi:hypothetical protein [Pelomonas sp. SE-A7]|uniref:hypothetical protein n=1 Tax=Pelomonas sp. SE-A7 TaxID=3054953 RepID=UPI00259CCB61|nr:hypothetical protein [Pelomonas sp. SE-A7]MDM4764545.1 hypothetical protein [Pelomonas sp. SE-A7]
MDKASALPERLALPAGLLAAPELEQPLVDVESCLNALGEALLRRDSNEIEQQASRLQQVLQQAIVSFAEAAKAGSVPPALRHRLVAAGGRVAAQRESLARATAALDRAMDVLMPPEAGGGLYGASGRTERRSYGGSFQA